MSVSRRNSFRLSSRKSLSLLVGLGAAGCMPAGVQNTARPEPASLSQPDSATSALSQTDQDDQRQQVVDSTVNDAVDRTTRILAQRAQAQQAARDIRELREARAAKENEALAAEKAKADAKRAVVEVQDDEFARKPAEDEATLVERLAAAVRKGESIDAPPTANIQISSADHPADADADGDFGDVRPAGMTIAPFPSGAIDNSPQVQIDRRSPAGPTLTRPSNVDPFLAVQEKYANRVASDPKDLSAQLELQLLRFLRGESVPAVADLSALEAEDRELIAAMCDALSNFRSVVKAEPNPLGSEKARPFVEMADRIRARSDLTLSSLTLCDAVLAYGNYEPITPLEFTAGSPRKSVLYCEVDGFLSQLNDRQLWETRLSLELRLYDDRGMQVWSQKPEPVIDASRKRRRDFFIAKIIQLPSNLRPGHYLLKASVRDVQANRVSESTIQFGVTPQTR